MIHLVLCSLHFKVGIEIYVWQEDRLHEEGTWMSCSWMLEQRSEEGPLDLWGVRAPVLSEPSSISDLVCEMWTHWLLWFIFLIFGVETVVIIVLTVSLLTSTREWADVFKGHSWHSANVSLFTMKVKFKQCLILLSQSWTIYLTTDVQGMDLKPSF